MTDVFNVVHEVYWDFTIVNYLFLVGISAGLFLVAAGIELFKLERYRKFTTLSLLLSMAFFLGVPLALLADLEQPGRFWEIFIRPNIASSPMIWGSLAIIGYGVTAFLVLEYFWFRYPLAKRYHKLADSTDTWDKIYRGLIKILTLGRLSLEQEDYDRDKKMARIMFVIAVPIALWTELNPGFLLGIDRSRALWNTPLLPLMFLTAAFISALGILIPAYYLYAKNAGSIETLVEDLKLLGNALLLFVAIEAFFVAITPLFMLNQSEHTITQFEVLFAGELALEFYLGEILLGIAIPIALLVIPQTRNNQWGQVIAGVSAVLGVYASKYTTVIGGQLIPRTDDQMLQYAPDLFFEIFPVVAAYLAVIAAIIVLFSVLPWKPDEWSAEEAKGA